MSPLPSHTPDSVCALLQVRQGSALRGNCSGASVYKIDSPEVGLCYLKVMHSPDGAALRGERDRLAWLHGHFDPGDHGLVADDAFADEGMFRVPEVLAYEESGDWSYLLTRAVDGEPCHLVFEQTPLRVARVLGRVLRHLHDASATACIWEVEAADLLREARRRVEAGRARPHGLHSLDGIRLDETPAKRLERLERHPPAEPEADRVLTHGDYCLPNLLLDLAGHAGLVDVGQLSVCDRHRDLAMAVRSLHYNAARPDSVDTFLTWYGKDRINPDRLLYWGELLELV